MGIWYSEAMGHAAKNIFRAWLKIWAPPGTKSPPTPALAQAGTPPGTTGGVEPAGLSKPTQACLSKRTGKNSRQLHASAICFQGRSKRFRKPFQGSWQQLSQLHAPAKCFLRRSRLPFARRQTPQTGKPRRRPFQGNNSRSACPSHAFLKCFLRRSRLPFAHLQTPQTPQTPPQAFPRQQLSQHMPQPCVSKGVQGCRLPALKPLNRPAGTLVQGNHFRSYQPGVFYGVRGCRLPALIPRKPRKARRRPFQGNNSRSTCLRMRF